jgi:hypothetical protein
MEIFETICSESLTTDQLIDTFKNEPLKFKPGSEYNYSNSNVRIKYFLFQNNFFLLVYSIRFNYRKSNWKIF